MRPLTWAIHGLYRIEIFKNSNILFLCSQTGETPLKPLFYYKKKNLYDSGRYPMKIRNYTSRASLSGGKWLQGMLLLSLLFWGVTGCSQNEKGDSSLLSALFSNSREGSGIQSPVTTDGSTLFGETQDQGLFRLEMTDFPLKGEEVLSVIVRVRSVEVHPADGEWITLLDYGSEGKAYDLLTLQNGKTAELGAFNLDPGTYDQIRLVLADSNEIILKDKSGKEKTRTEPLRIPSGVNTGIKLVRSFTVEKLGVTTVVVDFHAEKSVSYNQGQGYMLKPKLKVVETRTDSSATRVIFADRGGVAEITGEVSIAIPAGALARDTEITITPLKWAERPPFSSVTLLSSLYELGPDETQFQSPVTLTFSYDPAEVASLGLEESSLDLYYFDSRKGDWVSAGGVVDPSRHVVTARVNHFTPFGVGGAPTDAPRILPAAIVYATDGVNLSQVPWKVTATIKDSTPGGISSAILYYKRPADSTYNSMLLTNVGGDNYEAVFPLAYVRDYLTGDTVEVYIQAQDNDSPVRIACAPSTCDMPPHSYTYNPDVDGDGMNDRWEVEVGLDITINDALNDPDGDSFTNVTEYLNDTDPFVASIANRPPKAKVALPSTPAVNSPVDLPILVLDYDFDTCNADPGGYGVQWTLSTIPAGSALQPTSVLTKPFTMQTGGTASVYSSFTPDVAGTYVLDLTVTDDPGICSGGALTFQTPVTIVVQAPWSQAIQTPLLDWGQDLLVDTKGNVYATGISSGDLDGNINQGLQDIYLVKYDPVGRRLWTRTLGSSQNENLAHLLESRDGSIVLGGISVGNLFGQNYAYFIAFYDGNGNLIRGFNGGTTGFDYVYDIAEDSAGNIYVSGFSRFPDHDEQFLAKHSRTGTLLWRRSWTPLTIDNKSTQAGAMVIDRFDNIYIMEPTLLDATNDVNIRILKYDPAGNRSVLISLGSLRRDVGVDMDADDTGSLYITGYTQGDFYGGILNRYPGTSYSDVFLAKVDPSSASIVWSVQKGSPSVDVSYSVDVDRTGSFVAYTGNTQGNFLNDTLWNEGNFDYILGLHDARTGAELFFVQDGSGINKPDYGTAVRIDPSLQYLYLTGFTHGGLDGNTNLGGLDAYVTRYDRSGQKQ